MKEELEAQVALEFMKRSLSAIESHINRNGLTTRDVEVLAELDGQVSNAARWIMGITPYPPKARVQLPTESFALAPQPKPTCVNSVPID